MSSVTLCLFSVALCNIGTLDQTLFANQQQTPQPQQQSPGLFGQATNLFNGFVNQASLGTVNLNQQQGQVGGRRPQSPCGRRFQYVTDGRQWKGVLKIPNINLARGLVIEADFALVQGRNVSDT